jgi:ADP-ribose pyrophosphatase YjhB (NUDIX family)
MGKEDKEKLQIAYFPLVLAIIFDTKTKKILIGKRKEQDPDIKELPWCFPGGRPIHGEDLNESIKRKVKEKTGYDTESLGVIFAKTYPEKRDLLAIYFLCEIIGGKEKPNEDFKELKWVSPKDLEKHFTTSFHPTLKEYILNLE